MRHLEINASLYTIAVFLNCDWHTVGMKREADCNGFEPGTGNKENTDFHMHHDEINGHVSSYTKTQTAIRQPVIQVFRTLCP